MPNYIVLRDETLLHGFDGRWYDLDEDDTQQALIDVVLSMGLSAARFEATGDFEFRDDGAVAEVFKPMVFIMCISCSLHGYLPHHEKRPGFVEIGDIKGWTGPPMRCPDCSKMESV